MSTLQSTTRRVKFRQANCMCYFRPTEETFTNDGKSITMMRLGSLPYPPLVAKAALILGHDSDQFGTVVLKNGDRVRAQYLCTRVNQVFFLPFHNWLVRDNKDIPMVVVTMSDKINVEWDIPLFVLNADGEDLSKYTKKFDTCM